MTPQSKRAFIAATITLAPLVLPARLFAASIAPPGNINNVTVIFERLINFALALLTPLATIMVLFAGVLYLTSGGSEDKVKQAHKALLWAVIGIAIVLLAKSAELIIRSVLG